MYSAGYSDVVNLWNTRHSCRLIVPSILEEVGELVHSFNSFLVQHIPRSANYSAHLCAKLACTFEVMSSWLDCIPDFLVVSLQVDHFGSVIAE
jgi:hypothetical protein